ncbi:unnamed protein product [Arctogadus glacialis]
MHVDILYSILQKRTTDSLKTRQALENFSCSISELKDKLATDDNHPHPDADTAAAAATPRRVRRSDNVSVAVQCCDIMVKQSKSRFEKARHLVSFELIDPELFPLFKNTFPQKQLDIACQHYPMICRDKLKESERAHSGMKGESLLRLFLTAAHSCSQLRFVVCC